MSVVLLADQKEYQSISVTTYDTELQKFIDRAERAIVKKCGPLVSTAVTKRVRGGKDFLSLPVTPVLTLTSVVPVSGTALDVTKLNADPAGAIEYLTGGTFLAQFYDVTYTAGYALLAAGVPVDLLEGVMEQCRHLWESQQGSSRRQGNAPQKTPGNAYALTDKVNELIGPYMQFGFA